jgi:hypothetical protein
MGTAILWQELHSSVTTNGFGLITLILGKGARQAASTVATFNAIDWTVSPKFIKTEINYSGWKTMGVTRLWSVPYSTIAGSFGGPVKKLAVKGETVLPEEALFEVKNKDGQTVFAVYNEGVRVYVSDGAKALKGGFAVGGFGADKAESTKYLFVGKDSVRIYLDTNPLTKKLKGGFAVGGYDLTKGIVQDYLDVNSDSVRIYIDSDPLTKKLKGGFAVGGYDMTKGTNTNYMNVNADTSIFIKPSQNRIYWYPLKNAFLTGRVLIEKPDSVGTNSFASGYESKAKGKYSQALGYKTIARGDYSTAIGKNAIAGKINSFAFGDSARAINTESYAFGAGAIAKGKGSYAFGSAGRDYTGKLTGTMTTASGYYSFAIGQGVVSSGWGTVAVGANSTSSGSYSVALGGYAPSSGANSLAAAGGSANADESTAIGASTIANGKNSVALGCKTTTVGQFSVALGKSTASIGNYSTAMGNLTQANGLSSTAMGESTKANGMYSTAMGNNTSANNYATAMGLYSNASGPISTAMGNFTTASGSSSTAMGKATTAQGDYSIAMGYNTLASGSCSSVLGTGTYASGSGSTSMGGITSASGDYSTSMGSYTEAFSAYETAIGIFTTNYSPLSTTGFNSSDRLFVIGNGTSQSTRSNAMTVLKNGNVGIGTSSPQTPLHIKGNGPILNLEGSDHGYIQWFPQGFSAGRKAYLGFPNVGSTDLVITNEFTSGSDNIILQPGTNGKVGISTTTPGGKFAIRNGVYGGLLIDVVSDGVSWAGSYTNIQTGNYAWGVNDTPSDLYLQGKKGNVGIGILGTGGYRLYVNGTAYSTGGWAGSDIRWKKNIYPLQDVMSKLLYLNGVKYEWRKTEFPEINFDSGKQIGLIAQDVEKVFPELVKTDNNGFKAVSYEKLSVVLLEGMKEQQKQIESYKSQLQSLQAEVAQIKALLAKGGGN